MLMVLASRSVTAQPSLQQETWRSIARRNVPVHRNRQYSTLYLSYFYADTLTAASLALDSTLCACPGLQLASQAAYSKLCTKLYSSDDKYELFKASCSYPGRGTCTCNFNSCQSAGFSCERICQPYGLDRCRIPSQKCKKGQTYCIWASAGPAGHFLKPC